MTKNCPERGERPESKGPARPLVAQGIPDGPAGRKYATVRQRWVAVSDGAGVGRGAPGRRRVSEALLQAPGLAGHGSRRRGAGHGGWAEPDLARAGDQPGPG